MHSAVNDEKARKDEITYALRNWFVPKSDTRAEQERKTSYALQKLGLTGYQSQVYECTVHIGEGFGYQINEMLNRPGYTVPRQKIYSTLRNLLAIDAVDVVKSHDLWYKTEEFKYRAKPPIEFFHDKIERMDQRLKFVKSGILTFFEGCGDEQSIIFALTTLGFSQKESYLLKALAEIHEGTIEKISYCSDIPKHDKMASYGLSTLLRKSMIEAVEGNKFRVKFTRETLTEKIDSMSNELSDVREGIMVLQSQYASIIPEDVIESKVIDILMRKYRRLTDDTIDQITVRDFWRKDLDRNLYQSFDVNKLKLHLKLKYGREVLKSQS